VFRQEKTNPGASAAVRVQGGTSFSRGQQRTKRKEKTYFHKNKNTKGLVLDNEESDDEEE